MARTFSGGVYPPKNKTLTAEQSIRPASAPDELILFLSQGSGKPSLPLAAPGDPVKKGQKIGAADGTISATLHSPVSGSIKAIELRLHYTGVELPAFILANDHQEALDTGLKGYKKVEALTPLEIKEIIKEAGIVGMGGSGFPTWVKLSPSKKIDQVIINAAECEPYLTSDYRIILERARELFTGIRALLRVLAAPKAVVVIEDNKPEAIHALERALRTEFSSLRSAIAVKVLPSKYPQGGEKQIIKSITGREVPSGVLPADIGFIVINSATAAAIGHTLLTGEPMIERVVTVTGKILRQPSNLLVKIGTPFQQLIDDCQGTTHFAEQIISGGPMMGVSVPSLDAAVVKGTTGIIVLSHDETWKKPPEQCLRCAKCVDACPMGLLPDFLADYSEKGQYDRAQQIGAEDCIECGCCSYVCASNRNLVQLIKEAKFHIRKG